MCSVDNQPRYVKLFGGGDGIGIDGHGAAGGHETRIAESDEADADEEEAARRRAEEETRTDAEERKRDEEERRREEKRRKEERYVPCARASVWRNRSRTDTHDLAHCGALRAFPSAVERRWAQQTVNDSRPEARRWPPHRFACRQRCAGARRSILGLGFHCAAMASRWTGSRSSAVSTSLDSRQRSILRQQ
jgi:hypothetical protein